MSKPRQIPIGRQIVFAFGALCLVLVLLGAFFVFSLRAIEHRRQTQQARAHQKWELIDALPRNVELMQAEVFQHVLVTNAGEMERRDQIIRGLKEANDRILTDYETLIDNEKEHRLYTQVLLARKVYSEQNEELLVLSRVNRNAEAAEVALAKQSPAYVEYHAVAGEMIEAAGEKARQSRADTSRLIGQLSLVGGVLVGLAMLIAVGTGFVVARVTHRLRGDNAALQTEITERKRTEEQLRVQARVLDAVANAILITDHHGTIQSVNPAFTTLTGYTAQEVVGQNPRLLKGRKQDAAFYRKLWQTISSGQVWSGELTNRRKDGSLYDEEMTITPLRNTDGEIARYIAIKQDITERRRAGELLQQSKEHLHHLVSANPAVIYSLKFANGELVPTWISDNVLQLTGHKAEEIFVPNWWFDRLHPDDRERVAAEHAAPFPNDHLLTEYRFRRKDGSYVWVRDEKSLLRAAAGHPVEVVGSWADITASKKTIQELNHVFTLSQDLLCMVGFDGCFKRLNPAWQRLLGWTNEELLARPFMAIVHPDDAAKTTAEVQKLADGGRTALFEIRILCKDGSYRWVLWNGNPIPGEPHFYAAGRDITERKRAEEALRESADRLSLATESARIGIWEYDLEQHTLLWDERMYELYGIRPEEFSGAYRAWERGVHPDDLPVASRELQDAIAGKKDFHTQFRVVRPDGKIHFVEAHALVQRAPNDTPRRVIGVNWDITQRQRLEAQLAQSQKLETVGKLAGGIAHEFNSIMTAIIGQSELILSDLPSGNPLVQSAREIRKAADRAATLTRQLLAYGRKQILRPENLDLNLILADMENMLAHLLGADVGVRVVPAIGLKRVKADAGQIEQVIINMAINARDAMPGGGKLTLEASNVTLSQESIGRHPELKPGDYVRLAITDTGSGMSEEVTKRVFEPFFTTKGVGKGTGLGLATCYGIVKQSGGHINVYSERGKGTTFKVYLPQVECQPEVSSEPHAPSDLPRGSETVLLVEDDPALREMAGMLLRRLGYRVLAAANGLNALCLVEQRGQASIDLLFTDVVMPQMDGKELSDRIRVLHPETKTLFTSAYTENAIVHQGVLDPGVALLQKPFTPSALAHKVREILDGRSLRHHEHPHR